MPKALSREQIEGRKAKAVRFVRDVLGDPGRAEEIEDESLEDYAARRGMMILDNPKGVCSMPTKQELLEQIRELEEENEDLQARLDDILDIVAPEGEEEEEDESPEGEG
jgi:hypothetical protein